MVATISLKVKNKTKTIVGITGQGHGDSLQDPSNRTQPAALEKTIKRTNNQTNENDEILMQRYAKKALFPREHGHTDTRKT